MEARVSMSYVLRVVAPYTSGILRNLNVWASDYREIRMEVNCLWKIVLRQLLKLEALPV